MNKIIPFTKVITLNERFDEIKKIALDDTLKLDEPYVIKGDLIVRGCYKNEDKEEDFSYPIPVEIAIDSKYDTSKCSINVDDFYYEIINEQNLRVKIDLVLDDLYYKEEESKVNELVLEDSRNDNLDTFKEFDEIKPYEINSLNNANHQLENMILDDKDVKNAIKNNAVINNKNQDKIEDLFKETNDDKEYSVYRVYLVSEGETLEYILEKYKVTKEDLMPFNDLDNLKAGMKLIIPSIDE